MCRTAGDNPSVSLLSCHNWTSARTPGESQNVQINWCRIKRTSKTEKRALARQLSWLQHHPVHQKAAGSIPGQGTHLACGFNPWLGHLWEATDRCFSLISIFLFLSPFLSKINLKNILAWGLKKMKKEKEGRLVKTQEGGCGSYLHIPLFLMSLT